MDKNTLLHYAITQFQYLKNYDEAYPKESYDKVRNSFMNLFKKVTEYWNDEYYDDANKPKTYSMTFISKDDKVIGHAANAQLVGLSVPDVQSTSIENDPVEDSPIKKDGNPKRIQRWRDIRDANVRKMYDEAKENNVPLGNGLYKRIAQVCGTTSPKVRQLITQFQFDEL